jgi:class 3 adenylate cyclase
MPDGADGDDNLKDGAGLATTAQKVGDVKERGSFLGNLSLMSKLMLMLLLTSLASIATIASIGYLNGRDGLTRQVFSQLDSLRSSKKQQVEWYFRNMRETFRTFGEDVAVISAMAAFKDGYNQLGKQPLTPERRALLEKFYNQDYIPKLGSASFGIPDASSLMPRSDRALDLQALFIAENPNPLGERAKLVDHPVSNPYTLAHFTYHTWFRNLAERFSFYDVFLVDGDSGNIVYTVAKEAELGTSLIDGPYARSQLGQLIQQVQKEHKPGYAKISDFAFYQPSYNAPALFIATPIYSNWKFMGIMAAQISTEALDTFVTDRGRWRENGLGETGEIYLVGEDRLMRSNARGLAENKAAFLETLARRGTPAEVIDSMSEFNSTVLLQRIDSEGLSRGLQGSTSTGEFMDYRGSPALGSFTRLDIPDLRWALVVKMDRDEALAAQNRFGRWVMIATLGLTFAIPLLAMYLAGRFLKPVNALLQGIEKLRAGDAAVTIASRGNDEFGRLTGAFNTMAQTVRERDTTIQGKTRAYEALLRHIFPDVVAERMKKGEGQIVESFPQVSVAFTSVHGFVQATADMDGVKSIAVLNEIVDAFDAAAEELGIEKIKTIGEHYLAACGLSVPRLDHARRTVDFVDRMAVELDRIARERGMDLKLRAGIDSGLVHAGLVGNRKFFFDIWGKPPNVARRMVHETNLGEVRVSEETYAILGSPPDFKAMEPFWSKTLGELTTYGRLLGGEAGAVLRPARAAE